MSIVDDLMKPNAQPRILRGGPNANGAWIVAVEYTKDGAVERAELTRQELDAWNARHRVK